MKRKGGKNGKETEEEEEEFANISNHLLCCIIVHFLPPILPLIFFHANLMKKTREKKRSSFSPKCCYPSSILLVWSANKVNNPVLIFPESFASIRCRIHMSKEKNMNGNNNLRLPTPLLQPSCSLGVCGRQHLYLSFLKKWGADSATSLVRVFWPYFFDWSVFTNSKLHKMNQCDDTSS